MRSKSYPRAGPSAAARTVLNCEPTAIVLDGPQCEYHAGHSYVDAVDLGSKHDHSALVVLAADHAGVTRRKGDWSRHSRRGRRD